MRAADATLDAKAAIMLHGRGVPIESIASVTRRSPSFVSRAIRSAEGRRIVAQAARERQIGE